MYRLLFAIAILVAGCQSTPPSRRLVEPPDATVPSFTFIDARDHTQPVTVQEQESLGTTVVLGEDAFARPSAALVSAWLQNRSGTVLAGKKVNLKEFTAQVFQPAPGNDSLAGGPPPMPRVLGPGKSVALGNLLAASVVDAIARRSTSALVSARIEATVDGKVIVGLSRQSLKGTITKDDIYQVIFEALDDLSTEAGRP